MGFKPQSLVFDEYNGGVDGGGDDVEQPGGDEDHRSAQHYAVEQPLVPADEDCTRQARNRRQDVEEPNNVTFKGFPTWHLYKKVSVSTKRVILHHISIEFIMHTILLTIIIRIKMQL